MTLKAHMVRCEGSLKTISPQVTHYSALEIVWRFTIKLNTAVIHNSQCTVMKKNAFSQRKTIILAQLKCLSKSNLKCLIVLLYVSRNTIAPSAEIKEVKTHVMEGLKK